MNKIRTGILESQLGDIEMPDKDIAFGRYCFDVDFVGFNGHFPGYPVVPAFVQLLAAVVVMEQWEKSPFEIAFIQKAKFHMEIKPGKEIRVQCRQLSGDTKIPVEVRITVEEGLAADIRIVIKTRESEE